MRHLLLSLCMGLLSLNTYSQSILINASKTPKAGGPNTAHEPVPELKPTSRKKTIQKDNPAPKNPDDQYSDIGYMEIEGIEFSNTDENGTLIDNYKKKLYAKEIQLLTPRIAYKGLAQDVKEVELGVKIIDEDEVLLARTDSPTGLTYLIGTQINPGSGNYLYLPGWRSENRENYNAGLYRMEIWCKGNKLYQQDFRLYSGTTPVVPSEILSISKMAFANTDRSGKILSDYGETLFEGITQNLSPKIYYEGKYASEQETTLYFRYFTPLGNLINTESSPIGFSFKETATIKPGLHSITFSGFGEDSGVFMKEGSYKVEVWIDGAKLYETNVSLLDAKSASNAMALKQMLASPMMVGHSNPVTSSYFDIKNSVSSIYSTEDDSNATRYSFHVWSQSNSGAKDLKYHTMSFVGFSYMVEKDTESQLQRRMNYSFEIQKTQMDTPHDPYPILDEVIKEFHELGINLLYQRKNEVYLRAKGQEKIGRVRYDVSLEEYNSKWQLSIDVWVWK